MATEIKKIDINQYSTRILKEKGFQPSNFNNNFFVTVDEYLSDSTKLNGIKPPIPNTNIVGVLADSFDESVAYYPSGSVTYMDKELYGVSASTYRKYMGKLIPSEEYISPYKPTQQTNTIKESILQNNLGTHPCTSDCNRDTTLLKGSWTFDNGSVFPLPRNILSDTKAFKWKMNGNATMTQSVNLQSGNHCLSFHLRKMGTASAEILDCNIKGPNGYLAKVVFTSLHRSASGYILEEEWKDFAMRFNVPSNGTYTMKISFGASSTEVRMAGIILERGNKPSMYSDRQQSKMKLEYPVMFDFNVIQNGIMLKDWTIAYRRYLRQDRAIADHTDMIGKYRLGFANGKLVLGTMVKPLPVDYDPFCKWEYIVIRHERASKTLHIYSYGLGWGIKLGTITYAKDSDLVNSYGGIEYNLGLGTYTDTDGSRHIDGGSFKDLTFYSGDALRHHISNSYFAITADDLNKVHIRSANFREVL